jgi:hypothetical protein
MESVAFPRMLELAGLELNALFRVGALPLAFKGATVERQATLVHDVNGEPLFRRLSIRRGVERLGYADLAVDPALGGPLLAVSHGVQWNQRDVFAAAVKAARKQRKTIRFDKVRIVAYSFPKVAVQFLREGREVLMLEWATWRPVPPARARKEAEPSNFERWSLLERIGTRRSRQNAAALTKRLAAWHKRFPEQWRKRHRAQLLEIGSEGLVRALVFPRFDLEARTLHYSTNDADHVPCYELRGQLTNVWCVAASVQMILDFYRYNYVQTRVASELGLGTLQNPNGLPYSRDGDVVTVLQDLTSNALTATMNTAPTWNEFRDEIRANRPLVSFIPGHSRTVGGYLRFAFWGISFRGLVVYDPWPPTTGVVTTWENFDTQTYRRTFKSQLTLV